MKDCLSYNHYELSYVEYIHNIIDSLVLLDTDIDDDILPDLLETNKRDAGVGDVAIIGNNIPNGISAHLSECSSPGVQFDFVIADKNRGFLNHHSAEFTFIGPDREVTAIDNIQEYLHTVMLLETQAVETTDKLGSLSNLALISRHGNTG